MCPSTWFVILYQDASFVCIKSCFLLLLLLNKKAIHIARVKTHSIRPCCQSYTGLAQLDWFFGKYLVPNKWTASARKKKQKHKSLERFFFVWCRDRSTLRNVFRHTLNISELSGLSNVIGMRAKRQLINTLCDFHLICHSIWQYVRFSK